MVRMVGGRVGREEEWVGGEVGDWMKRVRYNRECSLRHRGYTVSRFGNDDFRFHAGESNSAPRVTFVSVFFSFSFFFLSYTRFTFVSHKAA